jgi:hypothetical protein
MRREAKAGRCTMKKPNATTELREFGRREFLRTLGTGAAVVAASEGLVDEAHADSSSYQDKSKARYRPNSKDIQNFYRVNRYPPKRG